MEDRKKKIPKEHFERSQENSELVRNKKIESLHANHLAFQKEMTLLQWELELIKYQLKVSVDKNEKIEGVCSWKRELTNKKTSKFDEEKFKKEHPVLYLAHYKVKEGHHKINIHGHRAYKPR